MIWDQFLCKMDRAALHSEAKAKVAASTGVWKVCLVFLSIQERVGRVLDRARACIEGKTAR